MCLCVNRILKLASVQHELRLSGFELDGGLQSEMMSSEAVPESSQLACEDLPFRFFFIFFFIYISYVKGTNMIFNSRDRVCLCVC